MGTVGGGAKECKVAPLLGAAAGVATGAGSAGGLIERVLVLLRVRRVCILLLRAGRVVGYGVGLGVVEGRGLEKEEAVRIEVEVVFGAVTGSSAVSAVSLCSPGSG